MSTSILNARDRVLQKYRKKKDLIYENTAGSKVVLTNVKEFGNLVKHLSRVLKIFSMET